MHQSNTYTQVQAQSPAEPPLLDSVNDALNSSVAQFVDQCRRLEALADRLLGTQPREIGKQQDSSSPATSAVQRLRVQSDALASLVVTLGREIGRLERL